MEHRGHAGTSYSPGGHSHTHSHNHEGVVGYSAHLPPREVQVVGGGGGHSPGYSLRSLHQHQHQRQEPYISEREMDREERMELQAVKRTASGNYNSGLISEPYNARQSYKLPRPLRQQRLHAKDHESAHVLAEKRLLWFVTARFPQFVGCILLAATLVLEQGEENQEGPGVCAWILTMLAWLLVIATLPFSLCVCFKVVQEYERAVIFRLGRLMHGGSKGPGIFFVLPCIENYTKVDIRSTLFDIPPQEILTKDSVTVSVDAVVYYRIFNANLSVANVENVHHSTRLLAQTTLRNVLGTKALHELLSDREIISHLVQVSLDESTEAWGIKVERVEVKDVRLPVQLQRAMAAEAEAAREARAKVISAEGEQKAARALKEAADIIADSPAALQLRYLQTLNTISAEKNSTIIFPIPMDLISQIMPRRQ